MSVPARCTLPAATSFPGRTIARPDKHGAPTDQRSCTVIPCPDQRLHRLPSLLGGTACMGYLNCADCVGCVNCSGLRGVIGVCNVRATPNT